jgi:hypothetical protein
MPQKLALSGLPRVSLSRGRTIEPIERAARRRRALAWMSDESWLQDSWIETVDLHDGDGDGDGDDASRFHLRVAGSEAVNDCEGFSGGMLWPAAYVLARWLIDYLARCPPADGATGLELGAGCGLGGITMARCSVHAVVPHTHTHTHTHTHMRRPPCEPRTHDAPHPC